MKRYKALLCFFLAAVSVTGGFFASNFLVYTMTGQMDQVVNLPYFIGQIQTDRAHLLLFLIVTAMIFAGGCYLTFSQPRLKAHCTEMIQVTPDIQIPAPAGQNQHGSARFMNDTQKAQYFETVQVSKKNQTIAALYQAGLRDCKEIGRNTFAPPQPLANAPPCFEHGGVPVTMEKLTSGEEQIRQIAGDVNTLCFGATRSGKSRTLVIQSIVTQALAGTDILCSDPKGELYQYTYPLLQRLSYAVLPLDFKNPSRSVRYNFLQVIIDAIALGDLAKAVSAAWDFVDSLVQEAKNTDPIWANGEKGLIAAAAMQVVYDNSPAGLHLQYPGASEKELNTLYETKHKHYQNCINLYHYIAKMTVPNAATGNLLLEDIIQSLPDDHPAKLTLSIAESAPPKTRGSFVTSALATLRLFTDPNIADMTSETDSGFFDPDRKKAIFLILPDTKETYYPLASLFLNQYYQFLADAADERGGRLQRDVEFNLDEFGNFTAIPFFDNKLSVGNGRGIHFHLYVQSKDQLVKKYGKEVSNIILDNCHYWIYLKATGPETLDMISKKLGRYTVEASSASNSVSDNGRSGQMSGSASSSTQLLGRELLSPSELERIERPYLLIIANGYPAVLKSPDLSQWQYNVMLGLGDKEHNIRVRELREQSRPQHDVSMFQLWDFQAYINQTTAAKKGAGPADQELLESIRENFL